MKTKTKNQIANVLDKYTMHIILVVLFVIMSFSSEFFFTADNLLNILRLESFRAIMVMGMGLVIIIGGIDLSIGQVAALASVITASLIQNLDATTRLLPDTVFMPIAIGVLAGLLVGVIVGIINGYFIAYIDLPPFIATLGTQVLCQGISYTYTNAAPVSNLRDGFSYIAQGYVGPIPLVVIYVVILSFAVWILLNKTRFGKHIYAIGGSESAARVAGIKVEKTKIIVYAFCGFVGALSGVCLASHTGAGNSLLATNYQLDAVSSCAIGGVSMSGGVGTVSGMLVGWLILGVLNNGMLLLGFSTYLQLVVKGLLILAAVTIDKKKSARRA